MKKILSVLFISSSLFSMQLAQKMQVPRFVKQSVAKVNSVAKDIALASKPMIDSKQIDLSIPKFKIDSSSVRPAYYIADAQLFHGKEGFVVVHNEEKHVIEKVLMNKEARDMTKQQLKSFLKKGFFTLNQTNDGKFTLNANYRLPGAGPIFGGWMYWLTKSLCYGTLVTAAATSVVATGGAVALAVAGPAAAASGVTVTILAMGAAGSTIPIGTTAIATTVGTTILTTAGVGVGVASTGTAVGVGTTLAAAGLGATATATKVAVLTTGAVVASGASTGGIIVGIEALSVAVGTFFGMLPTP